MEMKFALVTIVLYFTLASGQTPTVVTIYTETACPATATDRTRMTITVDRMSQHNSGLMNGINICGQTFDDGFTTPVYENLQDGSGSARVRSMVVSAGYAVKKQGECSGGDGTWYSTATEYTSVDGCVSFGDTNYFAYAISSTAGQDPIFEGWQNGQKVRYEVKGEPSRVFNLVTGVGVQLNAMFNAVPEWAIVQDLTETVLGDLGMRLCEGGLENRLKLDATSGNVSLNGRPLLEGHHSVDGTPVWFERWVCPLSRNGSCHFITRFDDASVATGVPPEEVDMRMRRLTVNTQGLTIKLTKQVVHAFNANITDCTSTNVFPQQWQRDVCKEIAIESRTGHFTNRMQILIQALSDSLGINQEHFGFNWTEFPFTQVNIEPIVVSDNLPQLHGLLGQCALDHTTKNDRMTEPRLSATVVSRVDANGRALSSGPQGQGVIQGQFQDYFTQGNDIFAAPMKYDMFACHSIDIASLPESLVI